MSADNVEFLLKEYETEMLRDRRAVRRKPFVRPVTIIAGRNRDQIHQVFSRDISTIGIGVISQIDWPDNTMAQMSIKTICGKKTVAVNAEARWTEPYGDGWFVTGWKFID